MDVKREAGKEEPPAQDIEEAAARKSSGPGRRLRVLTLVDRPIATGGGERTAATIASRLDTSRFESILCSSRSNPAQTLESELESAGVRVLVLHRRSKAAVWAWQPLISLLRRERVDILHAHKFGSNVWGTLLGRLAGVPVVVAHEHSWSYEGGRLRRFLDKHVVARGADAFVAVSDADRRRMIDVEGIDPGIIRVIRNGIPPLTRAGHNVREELGIPEDAPVIGTVAQLRPEKALDVLVDAAGLLVADFPRLKVVITGHGPEDERLRALVAGKGLGGTVHLLGPRSDVPDVLASLDVAVCCSDFEGTPLSVIEYLAAGKPVVATRVGGLPALVRDGIEGMLVEPRDSAGLAGAAARLLGDGALRREMGDRARQRQREHFDLDTTIRRLEDLYEELFAQTARARRESWSPLPRRTEGVPITSQR
jgi:glycosyltransferase involved in cell wall biosynthesis